MTWNYHSDWIRRSVSISTAGSCSDISTSIRAATTAPNTAPSAAGATSHVHVRVTREGQLYRRVRHDRREIRLRGVAESLMATNISWTDVPGWPGFSMTRDGNIGGPSGKKLRPMKAGSGHLYVLHRAGGGPMRKLWVHRAVLLAFTGPCPAGMESRHLDGNSENNRWRNLTWGTRYEQRDDDGRNGVRRGRPKKLTHQTATAIRRLAGHAGARATAREYGICHSTVLKIWKGRIWATDQP